MLDPDCETTAMDYARRIADFRGRMDRAGLDGYWLTSPANVRYLSGFPGEDSTLVVAAGRSVLITDSRYTEAAEREGNVDEVVTRHTSMAKAVAAACADCGVRRLGVTGRNLTHAEFQAAEDALDGTKLAAQKAGIAEKMRIRKDADEAEAIRASLRLAERTFLEFLGEVQAGRSERWLAARLEYEMRARGAEGASFDTICAVGANASMPHAVAADGLVEASEPVLFDWGARLNGYCSDLTRVVGAGTIPTSLAPLVDVVLEAQEAVFAKLKPGALCREADAAGRAVIARAGYGRYFGHSVGHGVGLAVHEGPSVAPKAETVLVPGMVVTVEPGVYVPGEAGVRIEEMALITPDGHEVLTSLPRRPEELMEASTRGT